MGWFIKRYLAFYSPVVYTIDIYAALGGGYSQMSRP